MSSVALKQALLWFAPEAEDQLSSDFTYFFYSLSRQPGVSSLINDDLRLFKHMSHGLLFLSVGHSLDFISDNFFNRFGTEELNIMSAPSSICFWSNKIPAIKHVVTNDWNRK